MLDLGDFVMMNMAYGTYLVISIAMTIWVARVLSKNGEVFLVKCFGHDQELAKSTNHLLVIGFYLVNVGFICMRLGDWRLSSEHLIPAVGSRVGTSILVLGAMHFFNMMMIARFGRTVNAWISLNNDAVSGLDASSTTEMSAKEAAFVARAHAEAKADSRKTA